MQTAKIQASQIPEVDQKGYLTEPETWTTKVAESLAQEEIPEGLTEDHWKIIVYMRQYFLDIGTVPPIRKLSRETGFTLREMKKLFPNGLANSACKIAGIPSDAIKPSFLYP